MSEQQSQSIAEEGRGSYEGDFVLDSMVGDDSAFKHVADHWRETGCMSFRMVSCLTIGRPIGNSSRPTTPLISCVRWDLRRSCIASPYRPSHQEKR
jgi:hypothetical protein